jgi:integrase
MDKPVADRGIFERPKGSGVWWIRWKDSLGYEHREKIGSKSAARDAWIKRKEEVRTGKKLGALNRRPLTVATMLEKVLPLMVAGKKAKGARAYEKHAEFWSKALKLAAEDVKPGHIERCKAKLLETLAPATVNRALTFLRRAFSLAVRDELITASPMASGRVRQLRENNQRDRYFSHEEIARIREAAPWPFWRQIHILLLTGLRRGELLTLRRENVDLRRRRLKLTETKAGEVQYVRLSSGAAELFQEILAEHDSEWVFPGRSGHTDLSAFTRRFARLMSKLQLRDASVHTTRHTFVSELAIIGTPLPTLQKLARHKSIAMTLRYAHLCPDQADQALESLCEGRPPS